MKIATNSGTLRGDTAAAFTGSRIVAEKTHARTLLDAKHFTQQTHRNNLATQNGGGNLQDWQQMDRDSPQATPEANSVPRISIVGAGVIGVNRLTGLM